MSQNGKLMPNLDQNSTKLLNLTVLQRTDPFVEEILITAAHVTLYGFNIDTSQWSRKDVEGSLFVVKRNTQPRFQFIVMNRRNTDNLVENLLEDFEFEIQLPYLLYRNAAQEVNGIWFYNAHECEEVATLFTRILNAYSKVPTKSKGAPIQSEFEELEAVPSMTVIDGSLEPSSTANVSDVPDDPSFLNFFGSAMTINNDTNTTIGGGQPNRLPGTFPQPSQQGLVSVLPSPAAPLSTPTALMPPLENSESKNDIYRLNNNLVKPSTFFNPPPSSPFMMIPPVSTPMPTAPQLHTPGIIQRPYGAPLLQPFPPPTPPPSLAPTANALHHNEPFVTKENIREALLALVQDNQFVDMVYRAILNAHSS